MEINKIEFSHPFFAYVVGKSNTGKTYFTNNLVDQALKKKFKIVYIVNDAFDLESGIINKLQKSNNVYVIKCTNLESETIDKIKEMTNTNSLKLLIFDNFSYGITLAYLDYITYARKYNSSIIFISHTIFASPRISPRLREITSYFILFYLPGGESKYKFIIDEHEIEQYKKHVKYRNFKKLIVDNLNGTYMLADSDYTPSFIVKKDENIN